MVAVTHRDADRFISSGSSQIKVFLVFGTDAGLVSERTDAILRKAGIVKGSADQITRIDGDELASNPGMLFEEAHGMGLFADKRAIIVRAGSKQIVAPLEAVLEAPAEDCTVIIQATHLKREAPLRAVATRARNAAAIECYPDQARDVERLIETELRSAGMTIDAAAKTALVALLGDDRLSTRAEVEKLLLYSHGRNRITEEDVITAVADASAFATDTIIYAAFAGDFSFLGNDSTQVYTSASEIPALLNAAVRHAHFLSSMRIEIEAGSGIDSVVDRMAGKAIFGARRDSLMSQVTYWRRAALSQCIEDLNQATLESRKDSSLATTIAMDRLLTIARRFRILKNAKG